MDRRHLKILMVAGLGLLSPGLVNLRSQGPGGPGYRPQMEGFPGGRPGRERPEQLSPEEHGVFDRNLKVWAGLPLEQKNALRALAHARVQAEVDKALQDSGLHLDEDQREIFNLRYKQERRKLERDLQRQVAQERARRMPEILARLKSEFGAPAISPAGRGVASPAVVRPFDLVVPPPTNPGPAPAPLR